MRSTTLFAEGNLVLCPLIYNDVLALLEMMLTASGQTMLCPADTNTKRNTSQKEVFLFGADNRIRTGDLVLTKDVLYLLSHISAYATMVLYMIVRKKASVLLNKNNIMYTKDLCGYETVCAEV